MTLGLLRELQRGLGQVTDVLQIVASDDDASDVGAEVRQVSSDSDYDDTEL